MNGVVEICNLLQKLPFSDILVSPGLSILFPVLIADVLIVMFYYYEKKRWYSFGPEIMTCRKHLLRRILVVTLGIEVALIIAANEILLQYTTPPVGFDVLSIDNLIALFLDKFGNWDYKFFTPAENRFSGCMNDPYAKPWQLALLYLGFIVNNLIAIIGFFVYVITDFRKKNSGGKTS